MKTILIYIMILTSVNCFSQNIAMEKTSFYSPNDLEVFTKNRIEYYPSFYNIGFQDSTKSGFTNSKAFRVSIAPAALFTAGALTWSKRDRVREARNRFIPTFEDHFDDITQFAPAIAVYGLNAAGIKGKHSLGRATVSMGIGAALTGIVVTGIKYMTNVERPDGSANNSFPSGHTATAFVTATFLHKEYGQYRDPLYSIAGYTFAGATAVGRQINNRHWVSDVLVGAGIGLLCTELGYIIADKIYKDRGLNPPLKNSGYDREKKEKPSFLLVKLGYSNANRDIANLNNDISAQRGYAIGLEGAWFFSKYVGVGFDLSMAGFPLQTNENFQTGNPEYDNRTEEYITEALGSRSELIGPYFNIPFSDKLALVSKVTIGFTHGARGAVMAKLDEGAQNETGLLEAPVYSYKPETTLGWGTGVSVRRMVGRNVAINLYWDFYQAKPDINWSAYEYDDASNDFIIGQTLLTKKTKLNYNALGVSVSAILW